MTFFNSNNAEIKHMLNIPWDTANTKQYLQSPHPCLTLTYGITPSDSLFQVHRPELDWLWIWLVVTLSAGITLDCLLRWEFMASAADSLSLDRLQVSICPFLHPLELTKLQFEVVTFYFPAIRSKSERVSPLKKKRGKMKRFNFLDLV